MDDATTKGLGDFFNYIWRNTQGYVYLPVIDHGRLTKYMFEWPRQRSAIVKHVLAKNAEGADAYYSPALFKIAQPLKENVKGTHVLWADFDGNAPKTWEGITDVPEPTLRVQSSSERNQHVYWRLANFLSDVSQIDERNRSIAYSLGADTSGWDANQFLRPPYTTNSGFGKDNRRPETVRVVGAKHGLLSLDQFKRLPSTKEVVDHNIKIGDLPKIDEVIAFKEWSPEFWNLFNEDKENITDRSGAMTRLGYFGAEHGFSDEQIYTILLHVDDKWGKYKNRTDREKRLKDIINYVREKIGYDFEDNSVLENLVKGLKDDKVVTDSKVVYGFKEFLSTEFHIDWLLEGLLPLEGFGVIAGAPGVGKTQFGIQLACHLALGEDFLGWKSTGKRKVLFASLEMGPSPLHHFMELIAKEYEDERTLMTLERNFNIMPIGEGIPFDREEGQRFIDSIMSEYMPDVLFIDSLQKVISKELTDELAMRKFTEYLVKHIRRKYNCAVYVVHHNRKEQGGGNNYSLPTLDDLHGSRFLSADLDFALALSRVPGAKGRLTVHTTKNRLAEERDDFDIIRSKHLKFNITDAGMHEGSRYSSDAIIIKPDSGDDGFSGNSSTFAL